MDKGKFIEQAQKYLLKGQIDKAIAEYQKAVQADPKDVRTRLKLGELYLKKGNKDSAVDEYSKAAESYSADGFNLQAIAVYKQLLKIDASLPEIYARLADLYRKQGLNADALAQYKIVINNYEKQGKVGEVINVLNKMASMDPENFSIRAKIADLHLKRGNRNDALEEYLKIANDMKAKGKVSEVINLYEKLLSMDPSCTDALRGLGEVYLGSGKKKEALAKLQAAIKGDPNDTKSLYLLAETYISLNELDNAKRSYEHILRLDPSYIEGGKGVVGLLIKQGDQMGAVEASLPVVDKAIEKNDYEGALSLLLEFCKNDIKDQQILEKMADVYRLKGEISKEKELREEISRLSETKTGTPKVKETEVKIEHQELKEVEDADLEVFVKEEKPEILEEVEVLDVEELPVEEHFILKEEIENLSKYLTEAEVYVKYGLKDKALDILKTAYELFPESAEVQKRLISLGFSLPGTAEESLSEIEETSLELELPAEDHIPEIEEEVPLEIEVQEAFHAPEIEEVPLELEFHEELLVPDAEELPVVEVINEAEVEGSPIIDIKKDLNEADFYIHQGLYDDAREVCNRILETYPGDEETLIKVREIDEALKAAEHTPFSALPAEEEAAENFFDLASELDSEEMDSLTTLPGMREAEKFGFEDIFSEFKKGVDSQLEKEDTETHYNLGIAYKEMGLLDDAVREFKIASSDPKKEFDCYNLIGICYIEKGELQKAIDIFKKGLGLPGRTEDEYASMTYELGQAYERSGMSAEATSAYGETMKRSPGFRDVEAKIAGLGGAPEVKKGRVSFI